MPVTYRFETGILVLTSDPAATFEEWQTAAEAALASPDFRPGMPLVHDSRLLTRVPGPPEVRRRIALVASLAKKNSIPKWAVVLAPGAPFGMGRMGEAYAEVSKATQFRAFKALEDALAWVSSGDG
jgi:hypothetical protein